MGDTLKGVELFAAGTWNQRKFTKKDLEQIAESFSYFSGVLRAPVKLGHSEEQKLLDDEHKDSEGQPAIGWISNVRVENSKLVGDLVGLPEIVYKAVEKKLYNSLSIELDVDVTYKSKKHNYVLTGVALLGAELPAVNTISDLSKYIDNENSEKPVAMSRLSFSFSPHKPKENFKKVDDMSEAEKEVAALRAELAKHKLEAEQNKLNFEKEKSKIEMDSLKEKEESQKALFSLKKDMLTQRLETLVFAKAVTPAQRDLLLSKVKEGNIDSLELVSDLADSYKVESQGAGTMEFSKQKENVGEASADVEILKKAKELKFSSGGVFSLSQAVQEAMKANPELSKEYVQLTKAL